MGILIHELSRSLAVGSHYQNLYTTSRSVAPERSSAIQQLRQERDHMNVHGRTLGKRNASMSNKVRFNLLKRKLCEFFSSVECSKSNDFTGRSCSFGSENPQISQHLDRSKEEVAPLRARCNDFWHLLEPTPYARDERYLFQELEWMQMEEHEPESATICSGRMGTDETRVEPSSFGATGDRLLIHLSSSEITAEIPRHPNRVLMLMWRSQRKCRERDNFPEKKKAQQLEFEACPDVRKFKIFRMNFRSEVSSCASRPIEAMVWMNEIESAKSIADLKTSYSITTK